MSAPEHPDAPPAMHPAMTSVEFIDDRSEPESDARPAYPGHPAQARGDDGVRDRVAHRTTSAPAATRTHSWRQLPTQNSRRRARDLSRCRPLPPLRAARARSGRPRRLRTTGPADGDDRARAGRTAARSAHFSISIMPTLKQGRSRGPLATASSLHVDVSAGGHETPAAHDEQEQRGWAVGRGGFALRLVVSGGTEVVAG